ncbi:MAG: MerR family transcriptional regulator [Nitrospinae bacterium]|nr:MerR family transcriptional regulator [Nitrospinota bacterium]MZH14666.1 MerR family transcriptional regulator [Nitrospinota bacterium]
MTNVINMEDYLSIGELADLTGLGVHTLRVWEKRYGAPQSQRLPSGHRRYPKKEVPRLRAIAKALDSGYRASKVVTATMEELQSLMGFTPFIESKQNPNKIERDPLTSNEMLIENWIQWIHSGNDDALLNGFHEQWGRHGALNFMLNFAVPLMERVGKGWETKELTISHEHFVSECMVSFLSEKWRQLNTRKTGPVVLITTLPGEPYTLGILMCAVVTSVTSSKVIYLGADNPIEEIIDAADKYKPEAITLSISHTFDYTTAGNQLKILRSGINNKISIFTGGKGSPENIPGVSYIPSFESYYDFLIDLEQTGKVQVKEI